MAGLIVALDTGDAGQARTWAEAVAPFCGTVKLGLEFVLAQGPAAVRSVTARPVFLDLKLHDIPNTVAGALRGVLPLRPSMVTLHAGGGSRMIEAARRVTEGAEHRPLLLAVTVLTSLDGEALHATGVAGGPRQQVLRLTRLALDAGADGVVSGGAGGRPLLVVGGTGVGVAGGADGVVCSVQEASALRDAFGAGPVLVVPGIRPAGAAAHDQARTATPRQAVDAGADWIVVGRPITGSLDPASAAAAIAAEIA